MYFKIGVLKNFANFARKLHVLEPLFKKALGCQARKFIKKKTPTQVLSYEIGKIFKHFFTEHFRWLVFKISNSNILFKDFSGIPLRHSKSLITCNSHNDKLTLKVYSLTKNFSVTGLEQTRRDLI